MAFDVAMNRIRFKARIPELKALENNYGTFTLSCRHKDMLRCSKSRHFRSCYAPNGINRHIPYQLCQATNYAIIGVKDKSGDYLWRAFVSYYKASWRGATDMLTVYSLYGNYDRGFVHNAVKDAFKDKSFTVHFSFDDAG
jgi:hypothetical protein